jgi:hypothetical protein
MGIVIGPVLKHPNGYRFDVWTVAKGVTCGYPYRRIEDASAQILTRKYTFDLYSGDERATAKALI